MGAYAKTCFLQDAAAAGVIVVSRLRKDAALWDVPAPVAPGQRGRGRPRKLRQETRSAWPNVRATGTVGGPRPSCCTASRRPKRYKTFLATYRPAGGLIRVVLVKEDSGDWRAYFLHPCRGPAWRRFSKRWRTVSAEEQVFHDVKEVHGVGASADAETTGSHCRGLPSESVVAHADRVVGVASPCRGG